MMTRFRAVQRLCHVALAAGLMLTPSAFAGDGDGQQYTFHWSVTTDENEVRWRSQIDWAQRVEFDGAPIRKDLYFFYGQFLGNYPRFGLHQIYMRPGALEAHLRQVRLDIEARIKADFDGYVCIDYENWNILWERLVNNPNGGGGADTDDSDYKDDWLEHVVKPQHPQWRTMTQTALEELCRSTYNAAAKEFMVETLRVCHEMRPRAKWGLFDYPNTMNKVGEIPWGDIGYPPDGRGFASRRNDEIQWLFDASSAVYPAPYTTARTVPDGEPSEWTKGTDSISDSTRYITNNVREAVRLAKGKPVISFMWAHYFMPGRPRDMEILNEINARHVLELPMTVGAQGVAMWDSINYAADFPGVQAYMRDRISPMIKTVVADNRLYDPYFGGSGGGSGGGGQGGGGSTGGGGGTGGGGSGSAGGWLPPPDKVNEGYVSNNAYVPGKGPTGTGGWVPPPPKGSNNTAGQGGGGGGSSTVKQQTKPYRVVVGSTGASSTKVASGADTKAGSKGGASQQLTPGQRKAAVEAIKRVNKVAKPIKVADVPTSGN